MASHHLVQEHLVDGGNMTLTEQRLRTRIRHTFHLNDPNVPQKVATEVEDQVLAFIRDYARTPEWQKDAVYAREEEKLYELLSQLRGRDTMNGSSSCRSA